METLAWTSQLELGRETVALQLPWPPSMNRYWRRSGQKIHLSAAAKVYRRRVADALMLAKLQPSGNHYLTAAGILTGPLWAIIALHPPTKQSRDLDNYEKALWDALEKASLIENDSQVCCCLRFWDRPKRHGGISLHLGPIDTPALLAGLPAWVGNTEGDHNATSNSQRPPKPRAKGSPRKPRPKSRLKYH